MKVYPQSIFLAIASAFLMMLLLLVFVFHKKLVAWTRIYLLILKLKGPKARPLTGNVHFITNLREMDELASVCHKKYSSFFPFWLSFFPTVVVYQPEHIQQILGNYKHVNKMFIYHMLSNSLGDGLITNEGVKWRSHRKYMQPYFNIQFIEASVNIFLKHSEDLVKKLKNAEVVNVLPYITDCIQSMAHKSILGLESDDPLTKSSPFTKMMNVTTVRLSNPVMLFQHLYNFTSLQKASALQMLQMQDFLRKVLEKRLRNEHGNNERCVLDSLIEISKTKADFTESDVLDEAITAILAGNDTISSTTCFTLYFLAKYREIQRKAREEVDEVLKKCNNNPSISDLKSMRYLTCCIKEAMRLYPIVPIFGRSLSEDVKLDNYTLPAGSTVMIFPYLTHRQPHLYPDPLEYIPERFSKENDKNRHPFAYIPFSAGPRICLGNKYAMLKIGTIVSMLLHRFSFVLEPEDFTLDMKYEIIFYPKELPIKFESRY